MPSASRIARTVVRPRLVAIHDLGRNRRRGAVDERRGGAGQEAAGRHGPGRRGRRRGCRRGRRSRRHRGRRAREGVGTGGVRASPRPPAADGRSGGESGLPNEPARPDGTVTVEGAAPAGAGDADTPAARLSLAATPRPTARPGLGQSDHEAVLQVEQVRRGPVDDGGTHDFAAGHRHDASGDAKLTPESLIGADEHERDVESAADLGGFVGRDRPFRRRIPRRRASALHDHRTSGGEPRHHGLGDALTHPVVGRTSRQAGERHDGYRSRQRRGERDRGPLRRRRDRRQRHPDQHRPCRGHPMHASRSHVHPAPRQCGPQPWRPVATGAAAFDALCNPVTAVAPRSARSAVRYLAALPRHARSRGAPDARRRPRGDTGSTEPPIPSGPSIARDERGATREAEAGPAAARHGLPTQ